MAGSLPNIPCYRTAPLIAKPAIAGKVDGRTVEIQRLIGRSLRAVLDLKKLPAQSLWVDCDVLQADGGTRTASITGAYVAAQIAIQKKIASGELKENPFRDSVAAVSVGVFRDTPILDLNYPEDKDASVDANLVMTGSGQFVEVQSSGEEATFSREQLDTLLALGADGIEQITQLQTKPSKQDFPDPSETLSHSRRFHPVAAHSPY